MTSIPLLEKDDVEQLESRSQVDFFSDSPVNPAIAVVAQEVAELLQQSYPPQSDGRSHVEMMSYSWSETIAIRAIEPEYEQIITIESLTARELEVLQLIVDGHNNSTIAQKLCISAGTVKTHVRNVLRKLYVNGRTQAAIRALRSGLVH